MTKLNAFEALEKFGLNWKIKKAGIAFATDHGDSLYTAYPEKLAIVRKDTNEPLGIVSKKYEVFDNFAFADFVNSVLENGKCITSGGSYRNGKSVWLCADLNQITIGQQDTISQFACFFTAHDGSSSLRMIPTNIRITCSNQFAGLRKNEQVSVRHTLNLYDSIAQAQKKLTGLQDWHKEHENQLQNLAAETITQSWRVNYFSQCLANTLNPDMKNLLSGQISDNYKRVIDNDNDEKRQRLLNRLNKKNEIINNNYFDCSNFDSNYIPSDIRFTKFHAFNAFTNFVDHSTRQSAESIHVGAAGKIKQEAFELAKSL